MSCRAAASLLWREWAKDLTAHARKLTISGGRVFLDDLGKRRVFAGQKLGREKTHTPDMVSFTPTKGRLCIWALDTRALVARAKRRRDSE